jgi:hypothetical protein
MPLVTSVFQDFLPVECGLTQFSWLIFGPGEVRGQFSFRGGREGLRKLIYVAPLQPKRFRPKNFISSPFFSQHESYSVSFSVARTPSNSIVPVRFFPALLPENGPAYDI